jgi:hypothetical protein
MPAPLYVSPELSFFPRSSLRGKKFLMGDRPERRTTMLVKARKRMVGNPEGVHEVLSKVLCTEIALVNIRQPQPGDDLNNGLQGG